MKSVGCVMAVLVACSGEPGSSIPVQREGHEKPHAPVSLKANVIGESSGWYIVSVVATPDADLKSAELRLILPAGVVAEDDNKPVVFGHTARGQSLNMVRQLKLAGAVADVVCDVRVDDGVSRRNRVVLVHLGPTGDAKIGVHSRTVTLPNGVTVDEVRE